MLGTDFNDRLPGIGPAKSFKLIEKYRDLETIEKETSHNFYAMKYKEIRYQMAAYDTPYNGIDDLMCNYQVDFEEIKESIRNSDAHSFLKDPIEFLENLENKKE